MTDTTNSPLTPQQDTLDIESNSITASELASQAACNPRTVKRYLAKGLIKGMQVDGVFGKEWRIPMTEIDRALSVLGGQGRGVATAGLDSSAELEKTRTELSDLRNKQEGLLIQLGKYQQEAEQKQYLLTQASTDTQRLHDEKIKAEKQASLWRWVAITGLVLASVLALFASGILKLNF